MQQSTHGFDTLLRRVVMIGAVILIWGTIIVGALGASAVVSIVHDIRQLDQVSTTTDETWSTDGTGD